MQQRQKIVDLLLLMGVGGVVRIEVGGDDAMFAQCVDQRTRRCFGLGDIRCGSWLGSRARKRCPAAHTLCRKARRADESATHTGDQALGEGLAAERLVRQHERDGGAAESADGSGSGADHGGAGELQGHPSRRAVGVCADGGDLRPGPESEQHAEKASDTAGGRCHADRRPIHLFAVTLGNLNRLGACLGAASQCYPDHDSVAQHHHRAAFRGQFGAASGKECHESHPRALRRGSGRHLFYGGLDPTTGREHQCAPSQLDGQDHGHADDDHFLQFGGVGALVELPGEAVAIGGLLSEAFGHVLVLLGDRGDGPAV
ncbi:hypothetical protein [Nocardia niwae]|uniref:hypothetical protein n=1 Tax=Nocardia niwae TaxID=626084 RepID=UPI0033F0A722